MRVHRVRGDVFLRPRPVGDGELDVLVRGDDDHRPEADGEVFRQAQEPARGVLFSVWVGVGAVWVAVLLVVRRGVWVYCVIFRVLSDGVDISQTRPGRGRGVATSWD